MIYADTSFFVSLYVKDAHSANADHLLKTGDRPQVTPLHLAEWTHAIGQQVFRKQMTATEADRLYREFHEDRAAGVWRTISIPEIAYDLCSDLGRRFGPKFGVRTLDSLHVACALELKAKQFWSFDGRQLKLARALGLRTR